MTIRDLTTKVANNGANVNGKLTAEEYNVLLSQLKYMSNGAVYMGIATPTTAPQTYDGNVDLVYIASQSGKYANFGNIVVNDGEICALHWQHSTGWSKEVIPTLLSTKVDKVEGKGLSSNDYTDEEKVQVAMNTSNIAEQSRLITRHGTTLTKHGEDITKNTEAIERKADKNGRYDKLTSGFAANIVGDGSATEEVIGFRPTAGEERNVANTTYTDGERNEAARIVAIKGNSVVSDSEIVDGHYSALRSTAFNQYNGRYAKVLAGVTYHVTGDITSIGFATEEGGTTEDITLDNGKYTPAQNGYIYASGENICIHLCWSEYAHMEDMYEAYKPFVRDLSWIKKYFPNGMRSAGDVRDEIDFVRQRYIKRVGTVDLGGLTWQTSTQSAYSNAFRAALSGAVNNQVTSQYSLVPNSYLSVVWVPNTLPNCINIYGGYIGINDPRHSDVESFKAAMKGVIINYAVTTPIVTPIDEDINLDYDCSDYGTEELISEGASAPLVADVVYAPNALSTLKQVPDILRRLAVLEAKAVENTNVTMEE